MMEPGFKMYIPHHTSLFDMQYSGYTILLPLNDLSLDRIKCFTDIPLVTSDKYIELLIDYLLYYYIL